MTAIAEARAKFSMLDAGVAEDAARWRDAIAEIPSARRDLHWLPGYAAAYASLIPGAVALAAHWRSPSNDALILQPFLGCGRKLISPYGFGGPVCSRVEGPGRSDCEYLDDLVSWADMQGYRDEWCRLHPFMVDHQRHVLAAAAPVRVNAEKMVAWIDLTKDLGEHVSRTKGHRAAITRARREGLVALATREADDLRWFHQTYIVTMARLDAEKRWMFPLDFLERLTSAMPTWSLMIVSRPDGTPEAGALVLGAFETAYYHYAGRVLIAPEAGAGQLLVDACARWAKEAGFKRLHLGGGITANKADPLLAFKRGFTDDTAWTYTYNRLLV